MWTYKHSEIDGDWRTDPSAVNQRGSKQGKITLTPLELIDSIVALIPPPLIPDVVITALWHRTCVTRIYEMFALLCAICAGQMPIISISISIFTCSVEELRPR